MAYLRPALDRIMTIQSGLTIADPVAMTIKKAYLLIPPASQALPSLPAFTNEWSFRDSVPRQIEMHRLNYTVHMQLYVAKATAEDDRSALIATAFWEAALEAFYNDITLNRTVMRSLLRGGEPTLAWLTRAGETYVGFDGFLDLEMSRDWNLGG